jgi:putative RecB family exonuclease
MADFNQARIMGTEFGQDDFQGKFESYWSKTRQDNISFSEGKSFDFYLSQGKALLSEFHKKSREGNFTVLAVEEPFQFTLNGMEVPMIGVIDLIEEDESGTIIVADYKTASKAYSEDQVDKNLQMTVYQMAAIEMGYRDRQILLRLDCLIKTKTPKFVQYYTQRTENDLLRAQKKIPKIWDGIRKGVFIPNDTGWKCNHCTYKRHCKQWFAT